MLMGARHVLIVCLILLLAAGTHADPLRSAATLAESGTAIVIAAVGDVMMPASIQNGVARYDNNYDLLFEKIAPDLSSADITFANLETTVDHTVPAAGYPRFNAPPDLLFALKRAGVTIVSLANNHIMDAGPGGLKRTIENAGKAGLLVVGAGKTRSRAEKPAIITVRGMQVAFLAYTYATNSGIPKKKRRPPSVNMLRPDSEDDLAAAAGKVRQARKDADVVVVSLHWSDEYRSKPTAWQRRAAGALVEAGADVIFGHHPHVLQPVESHTAPNGRQGVVAYSLGNFLSSQNADVSNRNRTHENARRGDGIILTVYAGKAGGRTQVQRAEFLPTWTLREQHPKGVLYRPVSISREISRIEGLPKRTPEENETLKLLRHRKKVITDYLNDKRVP